jgi:23S rRNA (guanosine2251-2'-O)-methyltransferase
LEKTSEKYPSKGQFIYGIHPVEEALLGETTIERIFIQKGIHREAIGKLVRMAQQQEVPIQFVPIEKLNRLHRNHQGAAAAVSQVIFYKTDDVLAQIYAQGELPLLLIADRITDVRNFGAITRTALCTGVHALIIPQTETASINSEAVKASAGALSKMAICREKNLVQLVKQLKVNGIQLLACETKGSKYIYDTDLKIPTAIIMGSEGEGISPELLRLVDMIVRIPMKNQFNSLNVSVATGMILYEAMKQRMNVT